MPPPWMQNPVRGCWSCWTPQASEQRFLSSGMESYHIIQLQFDVLYFLVSVQLPFDVLYFLVSVQLRRSSQALNDFGKDFLRKAVQRGHELGNHLVHDEKCARDVRLYWCASQLRCRYHSKASKPPFWNAKRFFWRRTPISTNDRNGFGLLVGPCTLICCQC